MVEYSVASAREDGSSVYLLYLEDGWINLIGDNVEENNGWKLLSTFTLEPGNYTLTGLKGLKESTIALQLRIEDDTGYYHYFYQYDEDVNFAIERPVNAAFHVRVYPEVEGIDVKARPAVYRNE